MKTMGLSRAVLLGCLVAFGAGCNVVEDRIRDEVRERADQGEIPDEKPPELQPSIEVTSVLPNRGETGGGDLIEIIGLGFVPGETRVFFGEFEIEDTVLEVTVNKIRCLTPPQPAPGPVAVRVVIGAEAGLLENGFEYYDPVTVASIAPTEGPSSGGTIVTISGLGFVPNTFVAFGNSGAIAATVIDGNTLTVSSPELNGGTYGVTVSNINGSDTLTGAFTAIEPLRLFSVTPFAGPLTGGTEIAVAGSGFVAPLSAQLGGQLLSVTIADEATRLNGVTLPGAPQTEGPVDLLVTTADGEVTLANAFTYFDANDPTPRVIAVGPNASLPGGGQEVSIVLGGYDGGDVDVFFGATMAENCTVAGTTVQCSAPPRDEGQVDIRVVGPGFDATAPGAFDYVDLRLDIAVPGAGAMAGGTYVTVYGNGFADDAQVFFDGRPASDITVVNGNELTLRTPAGTVGIVDAQIKSRSLEVEAEAIFAYFDPFDSGGGASGGPIEGAINVTVVEPSSGPVASAYVIVGDATDSERPYLSGLTNAQGQITLSGPGVFGPQSVHAGKAGLGAFSWVQINQRNLVLQLSRQPQPQADPLPECPEPGPGAPPPILKGGVKRIKDEFNTGRDLVLVTTTYRSFGEPLPDPGPLSQMVSQGGFELNSRTGDLSLIALAGTLTPDNYLDVHAMGFHPYLFVEPSTGDECLADEDCISGEQCAPVSADAGQCQRVYDDLDIVIDTPLNQPMRVELDNPPLRRPSEGTFDAPNSTGVFVWYDLGYMGLHPIDNLLLGGTDTVYVDMPKRLPQALGVVPFNMVAGVYLESGGQTYAPESEVFLENLTDTAATVEVGPLLKTPLSETAGGTGGLGDALNFDFILRPIDIPNGPVTANFHIIYDVDYVIPCEGAFPMPQTNIRWMALSAGQITEFDLPKFPPIADGANMPARSHNWQLESYYSPGASLEGSELNQILNWRSRSRNVTSFSSQ